MSTAEGGKAWPGFALKDCPVLYGDEIEGPVKWRGGSVTGLAEKQ